MPLHHVLMMINYDAVFFSQGIIDQLYFKQMQRTRSTVAATAWTPFFIVVGILLYSLSSPQNYSQTGFLFFYPLYSDYTIQCLYTSGTWLWIFSVAWIMHYICNKKFNDEFYRIVNGSSMYAYLSHYLWIILVAVLIIRPYQIPFVPALIIEVLIVNAVIILSYLLIDWLISLCFPRPKTPEQKEKEKKEQEAAKEEEEKALLKDEKS